VIDYKESLSNKGEGRKKKTSKFCVVSGEKRKGRADYGLGDLKKGGTNGKKNTGCMRKGEKNGESVLCGSSKKPRK